MSRNLDCTAGQPAQLPYGRLERVIDLSEAAAEYLGVGVSWVHAEIMVPTSPM